MQKFITSCFLFLSSSLLFGQTSKLSVFSENGEKFWVVMNGIRQNDKPQTNVKIEGLDQPNYRLRVIFEDEKIKPVDQSVYTKDVDEKPTYCTYVLRKNKKGEMQMKINSYQPLESDNNQNAPAGQEVVTYRTDEQTDNHVMGVEVPGMDVQIQAGETQGFQPQGGGKGATGIGVNVNINDPTGGMNPGINMNVQVGEENGSFSQSTTTTTTTTKTSTTTRNPVKKQNQPEKQLVREPEQTKVVSPAGKGCSVPAAAGAFSNMKNSLGKQSFEDTRLKMAKEILRKNCLSTGQIRELMEMFSFEKNKLDLAKFAHDYCVDKDNYYQLNDVFSFSSSVDELTEFLSGR